MGMHTTKVVVGEGKFALEAQLTVTPRGMAVYACSPEFAHLGATAQAIPRPEPGRTATVSILAVPCHRDEIPAHDIAAALATRFDVPVVASTGFHVENATADDLRRMLDTTKELIAALEEAAARILRAGWDEGGAGAEVVAVDAATGEALGPVDRIDAHAGEGILHQAFLTLLVEGRGEDARLLLCRRSPLKRLWGGVLADSCAGHPLPGEDVAAATVHAASTKSSALHASPISSSTSDTWCTARTTATAAASANGARSTLPMLSRASCISTKRRSRNCAAWPRPSLKATCRVTPSSWPLAPRGSQRPIHPYGPRYVKKTVPLPHPNRHNIRRKSRNRGKASNVVTVFVQRIASHPKIPLDCIATTQRNVRRGVR